MGYEVYLVRDSSYFAAPEIYDDSHFYDKGPQTLDIPFEIALKDFKEDEILMLPEGKLDSILPACATTRAKIVINNQNGFYALRYFPEQPDLRRKIHAVIANSSYNSMISRIAYKISASKVFYVPHWVVRGNFLIQNNDADSKKLGICYMPRKLPEIVDRVKDAISSRYPHVPWIEIDNVPESVVSDRLRMYAMFFAAQHLEGCPLTALEAMACNCLVAGFPGTEGFSHPYANPRNGYWAKDNDPESAIRAVSRMIDDSLYYPEKVQDLLDQGIRTANRYSKQAVVKALKRFTYGIEIAKNPQINQIDLPKHELCQEERWSWRDYFYAMRKLHHYGKLNGLLGSLMSAAATVRKAIPTGRE